ncbi:MAG: shikimate dehydrogenase [Halanaerobiales bacterium]
MINGKTQLYGLIGNPIEHTKSPFIHNTVANYYSHNIIYVPFKVDKYKVKEAVEGLLASNIQGLNITVPFKEKVIPYCYKIDKEAKHIGAINTLKRTNDGFVGYNTDVNGLHRALISEDIKIYGEDIIIIGAGGAAKATAYLCAREKAHSIYILNRTIEKANELVTSIKKTFSGLDIHPLALDDYLMLPNKRWIAIQTTPIGMHPNVKDNIITDNSFYKQLKVAVDLIYNPLETSFLKKAKKYNVKTTNGLKMLVYQAILSYEIWQNIDIDDKVVIEICNRIINK